MAVTMTGTGTLTGALAAAIILLSATLTGSGTLSPADLTALIALAVFALGTGTLTGNLRVARFMGRLRTCGDPLSTANQDWILGTTCSSE